MNSPLILIQHKLPYEIINIIQSYLINNFAYRAVKEYYTYLYYKKDLYEDFAYNQYILPNCRCHRYYNSRAGRWKEHECYGCLSFEYGYVYMPLDYRICIYDNPQFNKIQTMIV
jgi:hypothetical protein